jgi:hypothetical protein
MNLPFGFVPAGAGCVGIIFVFLAGLVLLAMVATLGWVLPICLGVREARKKNYSPLWMLFGIHPLGGWIAFIVLACLPPRVQCRNCGGFVEANFRVCPFCRADLREGGFGPPQAGLPR